MRTSLPAQTALSNNELRSNDKLVMNVIQLTVDLVEKELSRAFTDELSRLPDGGERDT